MLTWILVTVTAVAAIGVLALLVLREPLGEPCDVAPVAGPHEVRRGFRMVWPGYDPVEVDAHLAAIAEEWGGATSERSERDDRGGGRDRTERDDRGGGRDRTERDDRGGGRDRLREELEERGGDGAG